MAFTAKLESVSKSGDPGVIHVEVTYADSDHPDWGPFTKGLEITLDPNQALPAQHAAIRAQVIEDAQRYKRQLAIHAGLLDLVGTLIEIS